MNPFRFLVGVIIVLMFACSSSDPKLEIDKLVKENKIAEAKFKYQALVEKADNPNIERQFINFLFEHNQFYDFKKVSEGFLRRFPGDEEVKQLMFSYYSRLASDAERQELYEEAMDYIVSHLLSPDFPEFRKWESRQTTIFKKWYTLMEEKGDLNGQKKVLSQMKSLGFDNLAKDLAPQLYDEI